MPIKRIMTVALVVVMISSGLGITAVGMDLDAPETNSDQLIEPTATITPCGGKRVIFGETFTNMNCSGCPSHNVLWEEAIDNVGYEIVAPAYVHVDWPSKTDPVNTYGNMPSCAQSRVTMYGISSVPNAWIDGKNVLNHRPAEIYETMFEARMGSPSNFKITTNGSIDGGTRFGQLNARIEVLVDVPPGDYRIMTFVWEDNINLTERFGSPAGNGEFDWRWATWLMLPDDRGEEIWTDGASKGDFVDITRTFTAEPDWVLGEMGASVFIQDFDTFAVEQAAVDFFQGLPPPPPAHELVVHGREIATEIEAGKPYTVECTIYNVGTNDETNVDVKLTLDGGTELTQIVPFIESDHGVIVSFDWNAPAVAGVYQLGFDVTPVTGETNVLDNIWQTTIDVSNQPDIWITPSSFEFTLAPGGIDSDSLTIGNDGTVNLNYQIEIGTQQEEFGNFYLGQSRFESDRGNIYHVTTSTKLWEIQQRLKIDTSTQTYFFIYEGNSMTGVFNKVDEVYIANSGTGDLWYSSGPMNVNLRAGKYYYIGASWEGTVYFYRGNIDVPEPTSFGTLETAQEDTIGGFPPPAAVSQGSRGVPAYRQIITTGPGVSPWLTVDPDNGIIAPGGQENCMLNVDAAGLTEGLYQTAIYISSNDLNEGLLIVPVNLYVVTETHDLSVYDMWIDGLLKIGEPIWVNGTIANIGLEGEIDVVIQFQVDLALEDSIQIPDFPGSSTVDVSFSWTIPLGLSFDLTLYVVPVSGETSTSNNRWDETVNIPPEPIAWTDPGSFDFSMDTDQIDFDNLTIGNDGTMDLNYSISLGNVQEEFGGSSTSIWGAVRDRGNVYHITVSTTLREIQQYMRFNLATDMYFFVYEGMDVTGEYSKLAEVHINTGTGLNWRSSGPISVSLMAGKYYYIGASWAATGTYYWETDLPPIPTSFGALVSGQPSTCAGFPPAELATQQSEGKPPFYQRVTTGEDAPTWLSVNPMSGIIATGGQTDCMLTVDTAALPDGYYQTNIYVMSNDPDDPGIIVPVDLSVGLTSFDIPVALVGVGWEFISFPIGISGDVETVLDDSIFGDGQTTWDMVQWYDAEWKEWKSYATFKPPSLNNMPIIDNTMGVWVHITNVGDGVLTTGMTGVYSGPVDINLYTGWNLVGYPSATSRLASNTLPPEVDMVSLYDSGQPYSILDESILTVVTMQEGDAYWVHVTVDCTWQVDP